MRREINCITGEEIELPDAPSDGEPVVDLSALDQATLNAMLVADGSIMRAVVAVMRSEINILRAASVPTLPPRTAAQITAALKAQMR